MPLLLDENLPSSLTRRTSDLWPGSVHVKDFGLESTHDTEIWQFALSNEYVILTKDRDFYARVSVLGAPPKVIWLRLGNCSVSDLETILRNRASAIDDFIADAGTSLLIIE